ncbi:MAG: OmpA family protein [Actinomycetota bacterium]
MLSVFFFSGPASAQEAASCNQLAGAKADFSLPCRIESPIRTQDLVVRFPFGSSELTTEAMATLDRQAFALLAYPHLMVDIVGHVDKLEAATADGLKIGYLRALAVRDYLIRQGVSAERISTDSHGDREVLVLHDTDATMAAMRFARTQTRAP